MSKRIHYTASCDGMQSSYTGELEDFIRLLEKDKRFGKVDVVIRECKDSYDLGEIVAECANGEWRLTSKSK